MRSLFTKLRTPPKASGKSVRKSVNISSIIIENLLVRLLKWVHFKLSLHFYGCGQWRHRPQLLALAGDTSQRQFKMHPSKLPFIPVLFILANIGIISAGFAQEKNFPVPTGNSKQLFYLQRTPNTNTIVYELNYKNGVIDKENPIQEFWIRYQERGQREELSYIQKKFAYGIKTKLISENQYELSIVAYKKYKMYLKQGPDKKFYVYITINQKPAILTRIFLQINGGAFWSPNIEYIDVYGIEPKSRAIVKERLKI